MTLSRWQCLAVAVALGVGAMMVPRAVAGQAERATNALERGRHGLRRLRVERGIIVEIRADRGQRALQR